jgi:transposase
MTRSSDWSEQFGTHPLFAIEGTSSYGAGLTRALLDAGFPVVEVNRPDRSVRCRLGKDDAIDAEAAGRAYLAGTAHGDVLVEADHQLSPLSG